MKAFSYVVLDYEWRMHSGNPEKSTRLKVPSDPLPWNLTEVVDFHVRLNGRSPYDGRTQRHYGGRNNRSSRRSGPVVFFSIRHPGLFSLSGPELTLEQTWINISKAGAVCGGMFAMQELGVWGKDRGSSENPPTRTGHGSPYVLLTLRGRWAQTGAATLAPLSAHPGEIAGSGPLILGSEYGIFKE
ncbi:hypothetical protein RRG08_009430 [Elysia crispata]|uniref:Uncharacterized protein n=1 Tax=Elysia crispata TaxID=231223 RepID=A0AAE0Y8K5_9GAST|nr:hypothetical protein RRG08_009430 [Elysia crispata]